MLLKQNWLLAAARPPWDGSLEGRTPGTGEGEKGLWQGMELEGGAEALAKPKPFVGLVVLLLQAGLWCAFSWGQEQPGGGYRAAQGVPWDRGTQGWLELTALSFSRVPIICASLHLHASPSPTCCVWP